MVFEAIWTMLKKKHRNKSMSWIRTKYFTKIGTRNWCLFSNVITKTGKKRYILIKAADTKIRRHIKIKGAATPFDDDYDDYFAAREDRLRRESINSRIVNNSLKRA